MFCDQVRLTLKAGDGGDGCVSFRREKWVPRGAPDGGNGGQGGGVVLKVNAHLNTLIGLRKRKIYKGGSGKNGARFDKAGKRGDDLILEVPPGTLVYDDQTNDLIVDLVEDGDTFTVLHGGRGGFGNAHFVSSVRQAPDFAELGEPGETMDVRFEMKLVADVGIIGLPSVGKSTLISRITEAKPKIADYPFTTLTPNLGVVNMVEWGGEADQSFVVADVPGLMEGAHQGKGLGGEFLRHVSRSPLLVHLLDCQSQDVVKDYDVIMNELKQYDVELAKRPHVVVINKVDTIDDETKDLLKVEIEAHLKRKKVKVPVFLISAVSGDGIKEFLFYLLGEVNKLHRERPVHHEEGPKEGYRVFRPHLEKGDGFDVQVLKSGDSNVFQVSGKRIEQIVVMTDINNRSAVLRVYDVLEKMGILKQIRKLGAQLGDDIQIGECVFPFRG